MFQPAVYVCSVLVTSILAAVLGWERARCKELHEAIFAHWLTCRKATSITEVRDANYDLWDAISIKPESADTPVLASAPEPVAPAPKPVAKKDSIAGDRCPAPYMMPLFPFPYGTFASMRPYTPLYGKKNSIPGD